MKYKIYTNATKNQIMGVANEVDALVTEGWQDDEVELMWEGNDEKEFVALLLEEGPRYEHTLRNALKDELK